MIIQRKITKIEGKKKGLRSLRERDLSSRLRACLGRYLEEKERKREMGIIIYLFYYRNWFLVSFLVELKIEKGHVDFLPRKARARLFFFLFLKKEALLTSPPLSFLILRQWGLSLKPRNHPWWFGFVVILFLDSNIANQSQT